MSLRILVISDLHCHHPSSGSADTLLLSNLAARPERQNPVSSLALLARQFDLHADILLAPGDLTNRADSQGIQSGWTHLNQIGQIFRCKSIAATLGNHDVIWKGQVPDAFKLAKELLPIFPTDDEILSEKFWANGFYFQEEGERRLLVINSVTNHTNEASAKHGTVSELHLEAIAAYLQSAPKKKYQVALCHHHPIQHEEIELGKDDLMENGSRLVELLSRYGFSILVHGHKHHPRLRIDTSGGNPLAVLASGSFAANLTAGLGTRSRNVFHLLELNTNSDNNHITGTIQTWQFQHQLGWTPATQAAADFPHLTGFGSSKRPSEIANEIEAAFTSQRLQMVPWDTIVQIVPDAEFTQPSTFRAVGAELAIKGYQLFPEPPDRPKIIGLPVK